MSESRWDVYLCIFIKAKIHGVMAFKFYYYYYYFVGFSLELDDVSRGFITRVQV